jgi:general stress protein YciG
MSNIHKRGFASLTPERRREVASKGGRHAQQNGTAHRFTSDEARIAGTKGGRHSAIKRRSAKP